MNKVWVVAAISFREVLRRKVIYLALFLALLVMFFTMSGLAFAELASESGELELRDQLYASMASQLFAIWSGCTGLLGIFLGATAVSTEVKSKSIVTVLARPIERPVWLLGKWIGIQSFLLLFLALGIVGGLLLVAILGIQFSPLLWIGIAEILVFTVYCSGSSLALGAMTPAVLAGSCAYFLTILPRLAESFLQHPNVLVRTVAMAAYYFSPAQSTTSYIQDSFDKELLDPNYGLYIQVLLENLLYTAALFVVSCAIFSRREIRLK